MITIFIKYPKYKTLKMAQIKALTRQFILNYKCIPTLSRYLFEIPKYNYVDDFNNRDNNGDNNKTIQLQIKNSKYYLGINNKFGYNYHETNRFEREKIISSKLELQGYDKTEKQKLAIKELTFVNFYDRSNKIFLYYELELNLIEKQINKMSFHQKLDKNNASIINNLWHIMPEKDFKILNEINELINQNKKNSNSIIT